MKGSEEGPESVLSLLKQLFALDLLLADFAMDPVRSLCLCPPLRRKAVVSFPPNRRGLDRCLSIMCTDQIHGPLFIAWRYRVLSGFSGTNLRRDGLMGCAPFGAGRGWGCAFEVALRDALGRQAASGKSSLREGSIKRGAAFGLGSEGCRLAIQGPSRV